MKSGAQTSSVANEVQGAVAHCSELPENLSVPERYIVKRALILLLSPLIMSCQTSTPTPLASTILKTTPTLTTTPISVPSSPFQILDDSQTPDVNWPLTPKPLRCGLYLLPKGLVHVAPHSIFHIQWEMIRQLSVLKDQRIGVWHGATGLNLVANRPQEVKVLNSFIEKAEAITGCSITGCSEQELAKFSEPKAKVQFPQDALFSRWDSDANWNGANLRELGTRRPADGCYFTPEGLWFIYGCTIESFRWDDVKSIKWDRSRVEVQPKTGGKFLFPERLLENSFTEDMLVDFKSKTSQYWLSAPSGPNDKWDQAGHAVPKAERPTKIQVVQIELWS